MTNMRFAWDLANLMGATTSSLVNNPDIDCDILVTMQEGTYIHANRNQLVENALEQGVTHLFWLDDDMRFPNTSLVHLLGHNKEIVGANYIRKGPECRPTAIKQIRTDTLPGIDCNTWDSSTGLEAVEGIGFGCVLMQAKIFTDMDYPWFESRWDRTNERWVGEDVDFCMKAKAAGYTTYVDHDLSKHVHHVGMFEYKNMHHEFYDSKVFTDSGSEVPVGAQ